MTPDKCPGCGAKLKPDMTACPNCPMSFPENDARGGAENPLKQSPYYKFLLPALFFGGLAWGIWALGVGFLRLGEENIKAAESLDILREKTVVKNAESAPEGSPGAVSVLVISSSSADSAAPPAPARKPGRRWKLRGAVYDLTTLEPVADAELGFKDEETHNIVKTRTDAEGRYRATVPPLYALGYTVTVKKSGYAPNYLDPSVEDVKKMSAPLRAEMARRLALTVTAEPASLSAPNGAPVVTDFYLAPRP